MEKHQIKQQTNEMVKHRLNNKIVTCQRWRNMKYKTITPDNKIESQSRIANMCDGETSASNKCAVAKHRLKGNKYIMVKMT